MLRASLRREWARLRSHPVEWAMLTWVPLLGCLLVWAIFSAGLPTRLPVGVVDADHSGLSRQLQRFLQASPGLDVVQRFDDEAAAERALRRGDVAAVVGVPEGFSRHIKRSLPVAVTLWHNAQWGTHSGLIQRDVRTVVGTLSAGIEVNARVRRGEPRLAALTAMEPVRVQGNTLFNPALNYEFFLTCALVPALLHILAMTAGAWQVGVELRDGTVGAWLAPAQGMADVAAALTGKLLWPWALLTAMGGLAFGALAGLRGWSVTGSVPLLLGAWAVFVALSVAMGAAVAALTRSLRTALSATGFITAPAFAFSGVGFPLLAMPEGARAWAQALPYTHYIQVQIQQWVAGAPWAVSWPTVGVLTLAAGGLWALAGVGLTRARLAPDTWGRR